MLSLKETCFFYIMKTLEQYTIEELSLLPVKFREQLLLSLPLVDVCRLEETRFTAGLDMEAIWEQLHNDYYHQSYSFESPDTSELSWRAKFFKSLSLYVLRCGRPYKYAAIASGKKSLSTATSEEECYVDLVNFLVTIKLPDPDSQDVAETFKHRKFVRIFKSYRKACLVRQFVPPRYTSLFPEASCCLPDFTALRLICTECRFYCRSVWIFIQHIRKLLSGTEHNKPNFTEFFKDVENLTISGEWEEVQTLIPDHEDIAFKMLGIIFNHYTPKVTTLCIDRINASLLDSLCSVLSSYDRLTRLSINWDGKPLLDLQKMISVTTCQSSLNSVSMSSIMVTELNVEASSFCEWLKTCLSSPSFQSLGLEFYTVPSKLLFEILIIFFTTPCLQEQTLSVSLRGQRKIIDETHTIQKSIPRDFSTSKLLPGDKAAVPWLKSVTLADIKIKSFFVDSLLTLGSLKLKKLCLSSCSPSVFTQIVLHPCFEVEELKVMYMTMRNVTFSEYDSLLKRASLKSFSIFHCLTKIEASGLLEAAKLHCFEVEETPLGSNRITHFTLTRKCP